jgi:hypothetical protein
MRDNKIIQGAALMVTYDGYNAAYTQDPISRYEYQYSAN